MKMIARIIAETGVRDMFSLMHGCIRKNDKQANTVRLRNKWVQVDPRNWKTRDDMTINVGLGNGSRQEQVVNLQSILGIQEKIMLSGPSQKLVKPKNVFNTLEKYCERVGLKTVEPYFHDPEQPEIDPQTGQPIPEQPPPPDPEIMKLQMESELQKAADERKAQIETVQAQADMATEQQKLQGEMTIKQMEFQLKKELALLEFELEKQKMQAEEARKEREHSQRLEQQREMHEAGMREGAFNMHASAQQHEQKMEQAKAKPANGS
jgi:hypothetical protein